jgi:23S rRNA pseudouridine1911/1915/1917 synthase
MPDPSTFAAQLRVTVGEDPPARLDKLLARDAPDDAMLSRSRLVKLIEDGAVRRNGIALGVKDRVTPGEVIEITLTDPEPDEALPEDIPLSVVHEDDDLIVIDKPVGMVVHPAVGNPRGTLVNALLHFIAATACRASAVRGVRGSCTGSTRIPRGCWSWRNPTAHITGLAKQFEAITA